MGHTRPKSVTRTMRLPSKSLCNTGVDIVKRKYQFTIYLINIIVFRIIPNYIMKAKSERRRTFIGDQLSECRDKSGLYFMLGFQKVLENRRSAFFECQNTCSNNYAFKCISIINNLSYYTFRVTC